MKQKIVAGIVTYNPDIARLNENIHSIISQVDHVRIFDNGSMNYSKIETCIACFKNISCESSKKNLGIAAALNHLCSWALEEEYNWILTLDQDSVSPENLVNVLSTYISNDVGIVAPDIVYRNNEKYSIKKHTEFDLVKWVITSASLTNLKSWNEIQGFDEKLFIDKVDYDYGIRLNRTGFKVKKVNTIRLYHELGELNCRKIGGRVIYVTNHTPKRYYYMCRNSVYLKKKLGEGNSTIDVLKKILKVVLFEKEKIMKIKYMFKGIRDGSRMFTL